MLEKVKRIVSKKNVRAIGHFAHGSVISLTGASALTMGYIYAVCGVVACCNDHKVKKEYVTTTAIGSGLLYGGYLMLKNGIEEIGNTIVDITCEPEPKKPGITYSGPSDI